jgi:hypothetical protein
MMVAHKAGGPLLMGLTAVSQGGGAVPIPRMECDEFPSGKFAESVRLALTS